MAAITATMVKALRDQTAAPMGKCKSALKEVDGDHDKAVEWLQKHSAAAANKKADRTAAEGRVESYVHHDGRTGVLMEVNAETDFVGRNEEFQQFCRDLCMQVAAMSPTYVSSEEIPADLIAKQTEIFEAQVREMGKPEKIVPRIAEGKLQAWLKDVCLLEQPFVKDDKNRAVKEVLNGLTAKIGERLVVRRFVRFELGDGIEKKVDNFVDEVKAMAGG